MLGEVGKGIHSIRVCDIAIVDLIMTVLAAWLVGWMLDKSVLYVFIILFLIGIILHRVFAVNSTINKRIFGKIACQK
tara:strand:- start:1428 stop:1658 length:231 start_codon:yes stop_codon:yes gene_type:complete